MELVGCLLLAFAFFSAAFAHGGAAVKPKVPAIYVFGDSTVDVGNNNYLPGDTAKANYPHYGIDLPHSRPTGRFSNGYNGVDFLAIHMGFRRSPPPYLSLSHKTNIHQTMRGLQGINFASGGSGILDSTGKTITMTQQIRYFTDFRSNLTTRIGPKATKILLSKSVFLISSGGNDLFAFPSNTTTEQYIATILSDYKNQIEDLYRLGARKFLFIDVAPIGCCPYARALNVPTEACNDALNGLVMVFNGAVKVLMSNLSSALEGIKYSIGGSYAIISTIIEHPEYHGHTEVKNACCGSGTLNAAVRCNQNSTYCANRGNYLFWDNIHPTHATAKKVGLAIYGGPLQFASPINLMQLILD